MSGDKEKSQTFLGMPMKWDHKNIFRTMWNQDDDRIFPPKSFGIGWTINVHAALRRCGLMNEKRKK